MKIFAIVIISTIFLLTSCSLFLEQSPKMIRDTSIIKIIEVPSLKQSGYATWKGDTCLIELRKYPVCLAHEVRHCFEGHFHPEGTISSEDCN